MLPLDVLAIPALRILDHPQKNIEKKLGFPSACELTPEGSFCVKISAHYGEISIQGPIKKILIQLLEIYKLNKSSCLMKQIKNFRCHAARH